MKAKWFRSTLRILAPAVMVTSLLLSTAAPGIAASDKEKEDRKPETASHYVAGTVVSLAADKTSFTVQNGARPPVRIAVDNGTKYYIIPALAKAAAVARQGNGQVQENDNPELAQELQEANGKRPNKTWLRYIEWARRHAKKATFDDIAIGDKTIARVAGPDNMAKVVLIIKAPTVRRVKGTVSAVSDATITITPADGAAVVLNWDKSTSFVLQGLISVQPGQAAVASYSLDGMKAKVVSVK